MKTSRKTKPLCFVCSVFLVFISFGVTTVDPASPYVYGANIGWINAEADSANGLVVGQAFCSGYMYSANCGWIHLGNGLPVNGMAYANDSATDYGVNHDGLGNLSGCAYGANIGWIGFEKLGQPRVDLETGELSGFAWGANVGWISLATLATLSLDAPDSDNDGIADSWEFGHTNTLLALNASPADSDGDGVPDLGEYAADTDPFDAGDYLRITDFQTLETTNLVTWTCEPTRLYTLQFSAALSNGWTGASASFIPPAGPEVSEMLVGVSDTNRFYRIQAEPPLR